MKEDFAYSFVTKWKVKAPVEQVWEALYNQEDWPNWWKGVKQVKIIAEGDKNNIGKKAFYTWKSALPYTLSFTMESVFIQPYDVMEGKAYGELEGIGVWTFVEKDGTTYVQYNWDVNTTKGWMNFLAPILKPVFTWNHNVIMKWGANGLAKKLNTSVESA
jgi:uncharacterized protein YndB with AHSA1/START domain